MHLSRVKQGHTQSLSVSQSVSQSVNGHQSLTHVVSKNEEYRKPDGYPKPHTKLIIPTPTTKAQPKWSCINWWLGTSMSQERCFPKYMLHLRERNTGFFLTQMSLTTAQIKTIEPGGIAFRTASCYLPNSDSKSKPCHGTSMNGPGYLQASHRHENHSLRLWKIIYLCVFATSRKNYTKLSPLAVL